MRFFALAIVVYCYFAPGLAFAQDTARQLAGSWKLTSWTIQIIGGDVTEPLVAIRKAGRSSRRTGTRHSSSQRQIASRRQTMQSRQLSSRR